MSQTADEAAGAGVPLSETERKMLFFSESAPNARRFVEVVEAFEREVDEQQYERRITGLIRAARKRAHTSQAAPWAAAIERLEATDNYLGIMLDQAGLRRSESLSWRGIVAILTLMGAFVLFQVTIGWYVGHTPTRDEEAFFSWLAAMACVTAYLVGRWVLGAQRVEDFIGRVVDGVFRGPKS